MAFHLPTWTILFLAGSILSNRQITSANGTEKQVIYLEDRVK